MSVTVTPTGVREGDPAALAALCAVRGPSVVAYCRHVAGEAEAGAAAADAFARFRVAVVAAGDTSSLNPEALLISATRTSAAARADITAPGHCSHVPTLLATRAEKTIDPGDLARLEAHLQQCWTCRAPVARFKAAERAYRDPPERTVDPALSEKIVEALIAAVPPAPPPAVTEPSPNGAAPDAGAEAAPPAAPDQPTEHFAAGDTIEPELADGAAASAEAEAEAAQARARRRTKRPAGTGGVLTRLRPGSSPRGPRQPRQPAEPPLLLDPAAQRKRSGRGRPPLRLAIVLPIVLVLLALLAALYVSGVFGGSDPASSPSVSAPVAAPPDTTEPEVVAVPGAKDASADAVETAKARARGEGGSGKAKKRTPATSDGATQRRAPVAAAPPAAAAPPPPPPPPASPAVSPNNPVTRPAPARDTGGDEKQIDAGSGATGAEQIPPAADPTGVPDLAPPAESATP